MTVNEVKMNLHLIIVIAFLFAGCADPGKKPTEKIVVQDSLHNITDTLTGNNIELNHSISGDFEFDTTNIKANLHHTGIRVVQPIGMEKNYPWVSQQWKGICRHWVKDFLDEVQQDTVYIEDGDLKGYSMEIEPISLYKTDSVISVILAMYQGNSYGSGYFEYNTINFDRRTGRSIRPCDYFIMDTPEDSSLLWRLMCKAIFYKDTITEYNYWIRDNKMIFGFDRDNVYFCFEKYHPLMWGILSIRKKAIEGLTKKQYR